MYHVQRLRLPPILFYEIHAVVPRRSVRVDWPRALFDAQELAQNDILEKGMLEVQPLPYQ